MDLRLAQILFKYRLQPHSTTGVTPAELLIGRKPRTHLDLLHPDLSKRVEEKQSSQKQGYDSRRTRERDFKLGDSGIFRLDIDGCKARFFGNHAGITWWN